MLTSPCCTGVRQSDCVLQDCYLYLMLAVSILYLNEINIFVNNTEFKKNVLRLNNRDITNVKGLVFLLSW